MTKLLIGLTSGLYTFDLVASGGGRAVLPGVRPITFGKDPSEDRQVYCVTYNRGLCRSEDAGEKWLPVGTPQGFFEGPTGGAVEPRETTFVSVDPVPQEDGRHAVWSARSRAFATPQCRRCCLAKGFTERLAGAIHNRVMKDLNGTEILPYPLQRELVRNLAIAAEAAVRQHCHRQLLGGPPGHFSRVNEFNRLLTTTITAVGQSSRILPNESRGRSRQYDSLDYFVCWLDSSLSLLPCERKMSTPCTRRDSSPETCVARRHEGASGQRSAAEGCKGAG